MQQDDLAYFVVEISNTGTARASDTLLQVKNLSQCCFSSVEPDNIDIEKGENETFALRLSTLPDVATGSYNFSLKAISGSVIDEVNSTLNIIAAVPAEIKITDVQPERLIANTSGKFWVFVNNTGTESTDVNMHLSVPDTWEIANDTITKTIDAGEQEIFEFGVLPKKPGTFELIISMSYDDKIETKFIAIVVERYITEEEYGLELILLIISLMVIAILIATGVVLLRRSTRKTKRRRKKSQ